jgi:hypothetical protein
VRGAQFQRHVDGNALTFNVSNADFSLMWLTSGYAAHQNRIARLDDGPSGAAMC